MEAPAEAESKQEPKAPDWFDEPTWGRRPNLDLVMEHLRQAFPVGPLTLVEVGSLRVPGSVEGEGCASVAWGTLARERGGVVFSIDEDFFAVENANRLRRYGMPVVGICGRAVEILPMLPGPIHLLYLDGAEDPQEAREQLIVAAGLPGTPERFPRGSVVMVDDARQKARGVAEWIAEGERAGLAERFPGLDPKWNQVAWIVRG